jgi:hypothetical protein
MARRPTAAHNLALRAAEAAAEPDAEPEAPVEHAEPVERVEEPAEPAASTRRGGRPKGRRPVEARFTIYMDAKRHAALVDMAHDRGRSIHSLILEGIDHVIGKPVIAGWK